MSKQVPIAYFIIPTHDGYIFHLLLLLGLPYKSMPTYPTDEYIFIPCCPHLKYGFGIPVSLISLNLNMLNMMDGLNILVTGMVLTSMLHTWRPLNPLPTPFIIFSSVITYALLRNQQHPIFASNLFVGSSTPSSNLNQSGVKKLIHVSVFIINHP